MRVLARPTLLVLSFAILVLYQNCADPRTGEEVAPSKSGVQAKDCQPSTLPCLQYSIQQWSKKDNGRIPVQVKNNPVVDGAPSSAGTAFSSNCVKTMSTIAECTPGMVRAAILVPATNDKPERSIVLDFYLDENSRYVHTFKVMPSEAKEDDNLANLILMDSLEEVEMGPVDIEKESMETR